MSSVPLTRTLLTVFVCINLATLNSTLQSQQINFDLEGIAHTAIRVRDLDQSRKFYEKLGLQEAFSRKEDDVPTESFIKVNDRQFIELYPKTASEQTIGFLHVCFEADDLQSLRDGYVQRGLTPIQVRRAGAGNLLFTMEGPEKQNIEFTQYMPGSMHSADRGKHLGKDRITSQILAVGIPMRNTDKARKFYEQKMAFLPATSPVASLPVNHDWLFIPGSSREMVAFVRDLPGNTFELILGVKNLEQASNTLAARGFHPQRTGNTILVFDPDGNRIEFLEQDN